MRGIFLAPGRSSAPIYRVSSKCLGEEAGQTIYGVGNNQDERRGNIFGKMGYLVSIFHGDNSAGHCFVLRDLIQLNTFK